MSGFSKTKPQTPSEAAAVEAVSQAASAAQAAADNAQEAAEDAASLAMGAAETASAKVPTTRNVSTGTGLSGGGALSGDRTISIAAFGGVVSKSLDPGSREYLRNSTTVLWTIDAGSGGQIVPTGAQLPIALAAGKIKPQIAFVFQDGTSVSRNNPNTGAAQGYTMQDIWNAILNDAAAGQPASPHDGKFVKQIRFEVVNTDLGVDTTIDVGTFRVNAIVHPIGGGSLVITP